MACSTRPTGAASNRVAANWGGNAPDGVRRLRTGLTARDNTSGVGAEPGKEPDPQYGTRRVVLAALRSHGINTLRRRCG
jgi:hypothetical protein